MKIPELLAPGGSFESALAALESGADAVYCGLPSFSARKGAKNLSIEQLSRLRAWTFGQDKKIYVALNTLLLDKELPQVIDYLQTLQDLKIDALIIQDPALIRLVKSYFPDLPLHGSTQMAIHNISGTKTLKDWGFERLLMPREISIEEIKAIHQAQPHIELEAFIHGAQCYGFSGMCLASGVQLGRSANRGACGQICRTWFKHEKKEGFYLSSNDLWAGQSIKELAEAGIVSFKIEGRMKSPSYAANVSSYYRAILDGSHDNKELLELENEARVSFSRLPSPGHLHSIKGEKMVNTHYPAHVGLPLGKVKQIKGNKIQFHSEIELNARDGLQFLKGKKAVPFALRFDKGDKKRQGLITAEVPQKPQLGDMIYKIQSHDANWKKVNDAAYPLYKQSLAITLSLSMEGITVQEWERFFPLTIEQSEQDKGVEKIQKEMSRSGNYEFTLNAQIINQSDLKVFIPPSVLKKFRQSCYKEAQIIIEKNKKEYLSLVKEKIKSHVSAYSADSLPSRESFSPIDYRLPYFTAKSLQSGVEAPLYKGKRVVALPSLLFPKEEKEFLAALNERSKTWKEAIIYGLNNHSHISMYKEGVLPKSEGYFIDFNLYTANTTALNFITNELPKSDFYGAYAWLEGEKADQPSGLSQLGESFKAPLFISRNCFMKHSLGYSCKGCQKEFKTELSQGEKNFDVIVENCITWIF